MKPRAFHRAAAAGVTAIFLAGAAASNARADGGIVRTRSTGESMTATLFTPAGLTRDLATELTVLVQQAANGDVVTDANVIIQFIAPPGARMPTSDPWCRPPRSTVLLSGVENGAESLPTVRASRDQSDNRLLYGTSVVFPVAGEWHARLTVRHGTQTVSATCILPVGDSVGRLAVVWPWLAMPPGLIGLYVLNQRLRRRTAGLIR